MVGPPIRALDRGEGEWFHVDVVLRPSVPVDDGDEALAAAVAAALEPVPGPAHGRDPAHTYSFDVSPPEGEAGVSVWVRAASVGAAVDAATALVLRCAAEVGLEGASLWDLRVVPHAAVGVADPHPGSQQVLSATKDDPAPS
jgi:hypothetical protein